MAVKILSAAISTVPMVFYSPLSPMSTAAPTPFPSAQTVDASQAIADTAANANIQAIAQDSQTTTAPAAGSACTKLVKQLTHLFSKPLNAALLFAAVTWGALHYFSGKLPPSKIKLYAAGAFALILYGLAVANTSNPLVGLNGLTMIADGSTSNMSVISRLMAAWYVTFPAIALAASSVKRLDPMMMVVAADAAMLIPFVLQKQGYVS